MRIIFVLSAFLLIATKYATAYRVVCYYTNWAQYRLGSAKYTPDNLDAQLCDVIIYAFVKLSNNALTTLEWNDDKMLSSIVAKKQSNSNLKVLVAVGGWNAGSRIFSDMVSNSGSRQKFIQSAIEFLRSRNLDGLDMDWEYPANRDSSNSNDKQLFTTFLKEAKAAFSQYNLLLTAAVAAGQSTVSTAYEPAQIAKYLDWINLMAYDLHGSWESFTGFNAPLYPRSGESGDQRTLNVDSSVRYWSDNGFPKAKIILGMGLYGHSFTLANANNYMPGASATGAGTAGQYTGEAGTKSYFEICDDLKNGFTSEWNTEHMVPFIHKGNQWIGYDNIQSLQAKANYVKSQGLGGAMFWTLDFDDFTGSFCDQGKYPLINAVKQTLGNSNPNPTPNPTSSQPVTSPITTKSSSGVCSGGQLFSADRSSGCQKYYLCCGSQVYTFTCPDGLLFNEKRSVCDWSQNVDCNGGSPVTPSPVTNPPTQPPAPPTTTSKSSGTCSRGDGFYADRSNGCKSYYRCVGSQVYQYVCSSGLLFNEKYSVCDWPENVTC